MLSTRLTSIVRDYEQLAARFTKVNVNIFDVERTEFAALLTEAKPIVKDLEERLGYLFQCSLPVSC